MKVILTLILSLCVSLVIGQEKQVKAESKIASVTVFINGAQIERSSTVDIPAGQSQVIFYGLSPDIAAQSIQAKGEGAFTILSVNRQNNFLQEQKFNQEINGLKEKLEQQQLLIEKQNNELAVLKAEEDMISKNQVVAGSTTGLDLVKYKQALDFQRSRLADAKNQQLTVQSKIKDLQNERIKLSKQLNELTAKARSNTSDIVVKVSAKAATRGRFVLTYLVENASWYPTYDLRAKDISSPVELVYKANVTQRCGEDWDNIKLILSSGDPSIGGNKPELKPYLVGSNVVSSAAPITSVYGRITDNKGEALIGVSVKIKGSTIGTTSNISGYYSLQIPTISSVLQFSYIGFNTKDVPVSGAEMNVVLEESVNKLEEVVVVGYGVGDGEGVAGAASSVRIRGTSSIKAKSLSSAPVLVEAVQNQTNVQFNIKTPYTIPADGKQITVDIGEYEIPATYQYYAVPKLKPDAYLNAAITGINELNLLSGEANIFFEGAFLGKSLIDVQNSSDTLNVGLGVDKNIVVLREKQKKFNEKQFIGSNQKASRAYTITVKNRRNQSIDLVVEDQLPVATTDDVSVEKEELSGAKLDEPSGKLIWTLKLQPNEQKKLDLKYKVKYPKFRNYNIE